MTHASAENRTHSWLGPALVWTTLVLIAIALGIYAEAPDIPGAASMGRMAPRVPAPPQSLANLLHMLGVGSVVWYSVALALIPMLFLSRRVSVERHGLARILVAAVTLFVTLFAVTAVVEYLVTYRGIGSRPPLVAYLPVALRQDLLAWIALAAIVAAVETRRRAVQSRIERERLRAQIAEQRLVALTGQLHPHFLFNTLQGISTLIHRDPTAADEMLSKLSDLLRDLLRHRDSPLVRLEDEVRYIRTYLEISQFRFGERLRFSIDVSPDLRNAAVPLFILQPLVENALNHGIGGRANGGSVAISVWRNQDRLQLEVTDDGAGLVTDGAIAEGVGLANTRERLRASFGADQTFVIEPGGKGTAARIDVPYRTLGASS